MRDVAREDQKQGEPIFVTIYCVVRVLDDRAGQRGIVPVEERD